MLNAIVKTACTQNLVRVYLMAPVNLTTVLSVLLCPPGRQELKIQLIIQGLLALLLYGIFPEIILFLRSCVSFALIYFS